MHVGHVAAEHDDGAMTAIVAGVGKLESVGARDLELPLLVAREPHAGKGHRVVEKLQLVTLASRVAGAHRSLASLQAIGPEQCTADNKKQRQTLPHRWIMRS